MSIAGSTRSLTKGDHTTESEKEITRESGSDSNNVCIEIALLDTPHVHVRTKFMHLECSARSLPSSGLVSIGSDDEALNFPEQVRDLSGA